jgi:hypothetical protein
MPNRDADRARREIDDGHAMAALLGKAAVKPLANITVHEAAGKFTFQNCRRCREIL